jgi:hypothetical protein
MKSQEQEGVAGYFDKPARVRVYAFIMRHTIAADLTSRAVIKLVNEKQDIFVWSK